MYKVSRYILALGAVAIAVVSSTACASDPPNEAVVKVAGHPISKATLDHWIPIEAILTYELYPKRPVPRGVVPDPPDYTACIAYLEATPAKLVQSGSKPTAAQLKSQCRQKYELMQEHMLDFLITSQWVNDESIDLGVKLTSREVKQEFERIKREVFPVKGAFQRFLEFTGLSLSDELFRIRKDLLDTKIQQKISAKKGLSLAQRQQLLTEFSVAFQKRWVARTSCRPGYVMVDCKQYKGPQAPEAEI